MTGIFAISGEMTIFAIVSLFFTIIVMDNYKDDYYNSLKILKSYEPVDLIEKLKSKDLKAWHHFNVYIECLMGWSIKRCLDAAYLEKKHDLVSDFFCYMFGDRMRVNDLKEKGLFLKWISYEVGYFVLDFRKKKRGEPVVVNENPLWPPIYEEDNLDDEDSNEIEYTTELLNYLLDQIYPLYAKIIRMSVREGLKNRQIAEKLGCSSRFVADKKNKGMAALTRKATEYKKNYKKITK